MPIFILLWNFIVSEKYFIHVIDVLGIPLFLHRKMEFQHSAGVLIGPPVNCMNSLLKTDIYLQIFIKDGFCNSRISSNSHVEFLLVRDLLISLDRSLPLVTYRLPVRE